MPERLLLCTDLDRTLLPNGAEPESPGARDHFALLAADPRVTLAYVTGRHRDLVEEAIRVYGLPLPDYVIGDVGTTLYRVGPDELWAPDEVWEADIGADWNGWTNAELARVLDGIEGLRLQEESKQNRYKLSYYQEPVGETVSPTRGIERRLAAEEVDARLVWSVDEAAGIGLLDVLPRRAGKYHAVARLQALEGFADSGTVFSGDSGNDMEVLVSPVPAVLVANSDAAVQAEARRRAAEVEREGSLYLATGGFHGMNGNYAAGILEGVAHYHAGTEAWMGLEGRA